MMRKMIVQSVIVAGLVFSGVSTAWAVEVYLNGVRITGAKDQVIEKAKVVLDKSGNIFITAPGYQVQKVDQTAGGASRPPAAPTSSAYLTRKYYVVSEVSRPGVTGYTIQVMVNNKFLKAISDDISQHVLELNNYLKEGANTISFRAVRPKGKSALSNLAADCFTVVLGEGRGNQGGALHIERVLAEFKVTAIDRGEKAKTFRIQAR